ncbi:MAG: hypothetical protein A2622_13470 [Bdellovibrionales bacterium RIFCSPHIGHO2_01_FULL_40_29]|nr:MAG: hypothetical protein A2622_13470 [Bdellovibrionales bacterium RIFCSPHIGHO2_01_FULL_40_29]OFZ34294.1 MAG: hypothetical protein A3D17_04480 [Bdellovibrionales bacterium RIFCSPHIGHO2_02_FULL_40_15]
MNPEILEEYTRIEKLRLRSHGSSIWKFEQISTVTHDSKSFPLWKITCGSDESDASTLILVGGVHGLERIGSQLCISLLEKYFELSQWDVVLQNQLKQLRIVFIPMVNPIGIYRHTRSNGAGVDLMRNAPIVSTEKKTAFLIGGHQISKHLPWYMGEQPMQPEAQFLVDTVEMEVSRSRAVISLDIHSGFGLRDQIWFPWAFSKKPFFRLDLMQVLTDMFESLYPHHIYKIEPQSKVYCTHGDLWDYLLHDRVKSSRFLPLTLELGSWLWVKKNPVQIFNLNGLFNPIKQHRMKRIFRRHQLLIDFLTRFLVFMETDDFKKMDLNAYHQKGLGTWYNGNN